MASERGIMARSMRSRPRRCVSLFKDPVDVIRYPLARPGRLACLSATAFVISANSFISTIFFISAV
ncbi:hypothetical protein E0X81_15450 [Halomonas sp. GDM18]|nr:hypothetical protein E0X81_15450 [Halomonas sp. GDM18]